MLYVPSVRIKSSQQLCLSTSPLQASPVLSAMVADVRMLSGRDDESWGGGWLGGRDGDSWGGWSDMVEAVGAL
jgi:hypothetical protein